MDSQKPISYKYQVTTTMKDKYNFELAISFQKWTRESIT